MKVIVLGAGQIGRATSKFLSDLHVQHEIWDKHVPDIPRLLHTLDSSCTNVTICDVEASSIDEIADELRKQQATMIVNALPFHLNEKVARAGVLARCSYIDYTEDDVQADKVQMTYIGSGLTCVVKCGLAPGFVNYMGYSLTKAIDNPKSLLISVGALPRNVNYNNDRPEGSYALTWSVDGLVNEYIRPCRVRTRGMEMEINALTGLETVVLDGVVYEAAFTSGGVGSLVRDLPIENVAYKTLRYPGHYEYIKELVSLTNGDFKRLREIFTEVFPYTNDDMIVVYGVCNGTMNDGTNRRQTFSQHYIGIHGLTAIQSTTAGGAVAVIELILNGQLKGILNHTQIPFDQFKQTSTFKRAYKGR